MAEVIYRAVCPKCNSKFEGGKEWEASCALGEHTKYCKLPRKYKVLRVLLVPLAIVGIVVGIPLFFAFFALTHLAYPFVCSFDLVFDNEITSPSAYSRRLGKWVTGE